MEFDSRTLSSSSVSTIGLGSSQGSLLKKRRVRHIIESNPFTDLFFRYAVFFGCRLHRKPISHIVFDYKFKINPIRLMYIRGTGPYSFLKVRYVAHP
nr:MAG TPA: hypothetical protein [Myoviridae sp. ctNqw6]